MIPLILERRETETQYKDPTGKVIKGKHYILHINMNFKLANLQKLAQIEPTKALLELPAPEEGPEERVEPGARVGRAASVWASTI